MKCQLKYRWVKLPRACLPQGKGVLGQWARLAARAAYRKGVGLYCGFENPVEPGMWAGGVVGLKSILGTRSRKAALETLEQLQALGYLSYSLDGTTKKLEYTLLDWVCTCTGKASVGESVYALNGSGFLCLPRSIPDRDKECSSWEYVAPKLAAIRQSVSDDFVILFRTIANTTDTLDEAISRVNRAAELGADYAYVDGIKSYEELCQVSERAKIKLLVNMNERGACAKIPMEKIKALSYRIGLYPVSSVSVAAQAVLSLFETMKKTGSTQSCAESLYSITQLWDDMGLKDQTEKYLPLYKK